MQTQQFYVALANSQIFIAYMIHFESGFLISVFVTGYMRVWAARIQLDESFKLDLVFDKIKPNNGIKN